MPESFAGTARKNGRPMKKVAVITGASRGLGRVLAGFLAKQAYGLVITARGERELEAAEGDLRSYGSPVVAIAGDVTDPRHRAKVLRAAEELGRIDVLVNNASDLGESPLPPLTKAKRADLVHVFDVNVFAPLALVQEALPLLVRSHGLVVNITSDAAVGGDPGGGGDGASKAGLDLMAEAPGAGFEEEGGGGVGG